jgi:hypothetical protein
VRPVKGGPLLAAGHIPDPHRPIIAARGAIMIGGQRIQVGLPHAGKTAQVTIEADAYQITVEDSIITAPRKTSRDIKRHKAAHDGSKPR